MPTKEITVYYEDENGEREETHILPAKFEVCSRCMGSGVHDGPSVAGGFTQSEWADFDGEDREDYLSGKYDVTCEECQGVRVVPVVDEDALTPEQAKVYDDWCDYQVAEAEFDYYERLEREAERRAGC